MACRGCLECLLKILNFLLTLVGLAMVGYGIYLLVEYLRATTNTLVALPVSSDGSLVQLGRPLLMVVASLACLNSLLRTAVLYFEVEMWLDGKELGCAAFIFFDKSWEAEIPTDSTGDFDMIYAFLKENWKIAKWVALGAVVLEALLFLLALVVRAANRPPEYDSDDELIAPRQQQIRQPLINRPPVVPATGVPVAGAPDQRPSRNDAWSTRMREKVYLFQ
uniref:Tobamovirus multiplication protein 2A n=1 Tax=Fagus sylvatica TaxID=28930 RepID=A0A2N9HZJ9_FAGSY